MFAVIIPRTLLALALGIWAVLFVSAAIISMEVFVKGSSAVTGGRGELTVTMGCFRLFPMPWPVEVWKTQTFLREMCHSRSFDPSLRSPGTPKKETGKQARER